MKVCGVVTCAFVVLVAAGCDSGDAGRRTSAPSSVPVTSHSPSATAKGVTAAALRAALVREFRGARLDDGAIQFAESIASGPLAKLDHASTMENPWLSHKKCQSQMQTIDVGRTPDAPAAAITLRKSDTESGTQLLVGLSEGDVDVAMKRRVPAACRKVTVPGGGTVRVLGIVTYTAARAAESCPKAIELSRRLHDRVPS